MKTMKKIIALVTVTMFLVSFSALSQDTKGAKEKGSYGKMHIKIQIEKDGKTTRVDTTVNPEDLESLYESLKDIDIHLESDGDFPGTHDFNFNGDGKQLEESMKKLEEHLNDTALLKLRDGELFNMEEFEKQMKDMGEKIKDHCYMYKYKIEADSNSEKEMEEMEKELENNIGNMNFNFNDDGKNKTIIIEGSDSKDKGDKGAQKIIIKRKGEDDGKDKDHNQNKESKKVIIMMRSSGAPEKPAAEFAAEPQKKETAAGGENARVRVVDKNKNENNSWLNDLTCYPNPSTGEFTLSFRLSNPEAAELKIMDIAGREVFAENIPENTGWVEKQITLPAKSSAAYLLILRQGNNWHHEKIFVRS